MAGKVTPISLWTKPKSRCSMPGQQTGAGSPGTGHSVLRLSRRRASSAKGDVLMVTRLDRLARSTRDLLNTLAAITGREAGFRSLWRHMGRHHDRARAAYAGSAGRAGRIRARVD